MNIRPASALAGFVALWFAPHVAQGGGEDKSKPDSAAAASSSSGTSLVLLGTGTPNPDPDRSGPAVAVVVDGAAYLVDCGPGVVRRAAAASLAGVEALAVHNLSTVFITHLHSDHTLGYPDLILSPWVLERTVPLQAFGPPGLEAMTAHILEAYKEDIRIRLHGLEPANARGYKVDVHEIKPGVVLETDKVRVIAFPVRHGTWKHAFGFRFETRDRTIVISGDTVPCPELIEHARGCDILLHEVYSKEGFDRRAPQWQRYHASFHTSTVQLAEIANQARPDLLVLYHQLYWGATDEDLLREIKDTYDGEVRSAKDLDVF